MFNFIHTYTPHMSQSHVCQKAWYYHKWPTGLSWWCQIHPLLVEILLSNSMLREWPTGQSSCRIVGGVNPPQLLKSILRKYEVAQEEQWICLGSFLLLMEEILNHGKDTVSIYHRYMYIVRPCNSWEKTYTLRFPSNWKVLCFMKLSRSSNPPKWHAEESFDLPTKGALLNSHCCQAFGGSQTFVRSTQSSWRTRRCADERNILQWIPKTVMNGINESYDSVWDGIL